MQQQKKWNSKDTVGRTYSHFRSSFNAFCISFFSRMIHPEWVQMMDGLLTSSEAEAELIEDAEHAQVPSDEETVVKGPPSRAPTTSWWGQLLMKHTQDFERPRERCSPLTLISGCTGVFAEGEVLKDLWLLFDYIFICWYW